MTAFLLLSALSRQSEYMNDLTSYSGRQQIFMNPGDKYYLRFTGPYGVIHLDQMGYATGAVYYSSSGYYSSLSYYRYETSIRNDYDSLSSPSYVSFGPNYGIIFISSTVDTIVYYTYSYANSTCSQLTVTNADPESYSSPDSSTFSSKLDTYCFIYMHYGTSFLSYSRVYPTSSFNDQLYWSCGASKGSLNYTSISFNSIISPFQLILIPSVSGYNNHYIMNFTNYVRLGEEKLEGTFSSLSYVAEIYRAGHGGVTTSSSQPYWTSNSGPSESSSSSSESSSSSSAGKNVLIVFGVFLGVSIIASIILVAIRSHKKVYADSLAIPLATVAMPSSAYTAAPQMFQPYSIPAAQRYIEM